MGASISKSIAVLGGGITGLTAAYRLARLGHRVRIFEQGAKTGGVIATEITDGWLVEAGPNSFQESAPEVTALLHELGLAAERIEASPVAKHRYLVRNGQPVAAPLSPPAFFASPLFGLGAKLKVLRELLRRPRVRTTDLSLAAFIRAHFGESVLAGAVQPFVSGIYAGDPEKLSTRYAFPKFWELEQTHGSLLRGQIAAAKRRRALGGSAIPKIISFRRGLQTLTDALASRLAPDAIVLDARVQSLVPGSPWQVIWSDASGVHTDPFDAVVTALPAPALARLTFGTFGERPLAVLDNIDHPPVSSLFLGFRREDVAHPLDGFGVLVPARERGSILGIIFSSSLFPDRAPAGHVALTVFIGGALQAEAARRPIQEMTASTLRDLRELLGVRGEPVFVRHAFWPKAIPQYNLGYERFLEVMAACEKRYDGLFLGGSARDGIALPNCIQAGLKLAERASA